MSAKDDGGQVYPGFLEYDDKIETWDGITLRDYLAAQAIAGWNRNMVAYEWGEDVMEKAAKVAYGIADAMLRERSK